MSTTNRNASASRLSSDKPVSKGPVITLKKKKVENKPSATKAAAVMTPEQQKQQALRAEFAKKTAQAPVATPKPVIQPEPKKVEPVKEEPVKVEAPVVEEPVKKAPAKKAPVVEEVKVEEPVVEEVKEEPVKEEPAKKEPVKKAPAKKVVVKQVVVKKPAPKAKPEPKPVKPATKVEAVKPEPKKPAKTVYHVSKRDRDGREWKVFIQGSTKVIKLFDTQLEALNYAKSLCKNKDDGSYVLLHGLDGRIRKY